MRIALALIAALSLSGLGAVAQDIPPEDEDGRYMLREADDGVLRIDRETGATSICREEAGGWACRAVPDEREALEDEIGWLAEQNARLNQRVEELEDQLAALDATPAPEDEDGTRLELPSDAEIDRVMDSFERMMRRFLGMVRSLKEDFESESP